jgi:tetrahydromethanopterin S-methyltransferase subunit B
MKYKPYPQEKRTFILNKSDDELWAFFDEICHQDKHKIQKIITQIFPKKVQGFRVSSPKGVRQRFRMLIQEARGSETSANTQKAWNAISLIWSTWIASHPVLQTLLEHYDNSADFQDDGTALPANTSLDIGCFTYIVHATQTHKLSRAVIQRFYEFGYFQLDSTIEFVIKTIQAPAEKPNNVGERVENDLTRDKWQKALQELQRRVAQIEAHEQKPAETEQQQLLEKHLVEIQQQNIFARVSTLEKNQHNLATQLSRVEKHENLSQTVNAINHQLEMTPTTLDLDELKQQFDGLEKQMSGEISSTVKLMVKLISQQQAAFALKTKVNELKQQLIAIPIKTDVDELKQQVKKLQKTLSEQFAELEQHNTTSSTYDSAKYLIQQTGLYTSEVQGSDSPHILSSTEELVSHLTDNLKAIGLIKGGAEDLAKEILAGLSAGEIIVFSGSFAFNLAEICTQALAASAKQPPVVIHIPIGLLNGQQFGDYLWTTINNAKRSEQVCAIIIEGLNRSALETYAQALRQIIIKRFLGQPDPAPNTLFFGTLAEGLSTLPVPLELCELGPIFDTDVLGWRRQFKTQTSIAGAIPCSVWQTKFAKTEAKNDSFDLTQIGNDFAFFRSHLWQLCVKQASRYLDNNLQSLAFGWLVPRAMAAEVERREIKDWLQDDVLDNIKKNTPLYKLLRNHPETDNE